MIQIQYERFRGNVIQIQNSIIFCLFPFGRVIHIGNNIPKYLSHALNIARLINRHIFSLSKMILFLYGKVIQIHQFIQEHFDLDQFTSETYGKWLLKCYKKILYGYISLCYANHYQINTGAR